jgi:hypothetical protein
MSEEYDETDMEALRRAMEIAMRDPDRKQQLESMVNGDGYPGAKPQPRNEVAQFAALCVQSDTLNLKLWETPPCHASERDAAAMKLLDRMLDAGISQWEPDPLGALAAKG